MKYILLLVLLLIIAILCIYGKIEKFECTTLIELDKKGGIPEKSCVINNNELIVFRNANNKTINLSIRSLGNNTFSRDISLTYDEKHHIRLKKGKYYYYINNRAHSKKYITVT